jgi:2-dehydro-3-deoxygalactonokinase
LPGGGGACIRAVADEDRAVTTGARKTLIAVDWGTSSLRAALVGPDGAALERRGTADGIMAMAGRAYPEVLSGLVGPWRSAHPDAPILMSGMVGSRQGWREAPYVACPAGLGDLVAGLVEVDAGPLGAARIVPGLSVEPESGAPDVIRGEEVQVFGAMRRAGVEAGLFVLPGTHGKWVRVEAGRVAAFRTFMTGELYAVLRRHSILGRLMPDADPDPPDLAAFDRGAAASLDAPAGAILNALFSARTLGLFGALPAEALPGYLSGLLIGEEVREALALDAAPDAVHLIARPDLAGLYGRCLATRGIAARASDGDAFLGLHALARAGGLI